jgi:hypothetical protein
MIDTGAVREDLVAYIHTYKLIMHEHASQDLSERPVYQIPGKLPAPRQHC